MPSAVSRQPPPRANASATRVLRVLTFTSRTRKLSRLPAESPTEERHVPVPSALSKTGAAAAAVLATPRVLSAAESQGLLTSPTPLITAPTAEPYVIELAAEALGAAKDAGASYVDVRIGRYRRQSVNTRERQITGVSDTESYGLGVRALVNGSWGFAATSAMTKEGVVKAAREAARIAKAAKGRYKSDR